MSEPSSTGFPVTTALQLQGMTVERDLGVAFGLVVRSMGFAKGVAAGFSAKHPRKSGHAHAAKPAAGWLPTDERFRDPTTRVVMRVWIDPSTQPETRWYIPDDQQ